MKIFETKSKDELYRFNNGIVLKFGGKRNVISTSVLNGGYREDIRQVFNKDECIGAGIACKMRAETYEKHLALIAEELGVNPDETTGISTAAQMINLAIVEENYHDISITAFVTGGIEVNGGRVGDKATYDEYLKNKKEFKTGTINILLYLDAKLPAGILTRALVTCTEAKTAALQELMADSKYSNGLATGSGTDGSIIIGNMESKYELTNAGKHSVFGEIIGKVVKKAVKKALLLQTGLSSENQHSAIKRIRRFGVNENNLWDDYLDKKMDKAEFMHALYSIEKDELLVTLTIAFIHLLDEFNWGLIKVNEFNEASLIILNEISKKYCQKQLKEDVKSENIEQMVSKYKKLLLEIIIKSS